MCVVGKGQRERDRSATQEERTAAGQRLGAHWVGRSRASGGLDLRKKRDTSSVAAQVVRVQIGRWEKYVYSCEYVRHRVYS